MDIFALPEKAKEAAEAIRPTIELLQNGQLQDLPNTDIKGRLAVLTGWHARMGVMGAQAHALYLRRKAQTREVWAGIFRQARNGRLSANAAKGIADADQVYIEAMTVEAEAHGKYHQMERNYEIAKESMQSLKKIMDANIREEAR